MFQVLEASEDSMPTLYLRETEGRRPRPARFHHDLKTLHGPNFILKTINSQGFPLNSWELNNVAAHRTRLVRLKTIIEIF